MRSATRVVVGAAFAAALLAACGGSSKPSSTSTRAASTNTAGAATATASTVAGTPRPGVFPTPAVADGVYTFADKGYAIRPPDGWQARPNLVFDQAGSRFPADAFFAPGPAGGAQANIVSQCMKPRAEQATTDAFRDAWKQYIQQVAKVDATAEPATVAGKPAWRFAYTQPLPENTAPGDPKAVGKVDVLLVNGDCRWMFTLTSPPGDEATNGPLFDAALASVRFLS